MKLGVCCRGGSLLVLFLVAVGSASACGPGRGGSGRQRPRKLTPLVFKQHVPNVSENTLAASGLAEGRVARPDERFRNLVPNYNEDIIFKDEEGTGADRLMTQRCNEKLNTLAISVMNQWPGVRLRVTEGWDEEGLHAAESLHYEGRAVDITTSDRDRSKYGMLARLAVEAGFDWVYYESRAHIHCSVKSESSQAAKTGGCFPGDAHAILESGERRPLRNLRPGNKVLSQDPATGQLGYSEVLMFIDRTPKEMRQFLRFKTSSNRTITITPAHLLPVWNGKDEDKKTNESLSWTESSVRATFADRVKVGDYLLVRDLNGYVILDKVVDVQLVLDEGAYAPLTRAGTLVVDDVVVSCYALIDSQYVAHWAFAPLRMARSILGSLWPSSSTGSVGVHWYARTLHSMGVNLLPESWLHK